MRSSSGEQPDRSEESRRAQVVTNMEHELLNDLAAISTYVSLITGELLTSHADLTPQLSLDLEQVCLAAERARTLGSLLIDTAMVGTRSI